MKEQRTAAVRQPNNKIFVIRDGVIDLILSDTLIM